MLTRTRLLWLGPSGSFVDFGFSAGFFLNRWVEKELDLFIQRPMPLFSASSAPPELACLCPNDVHDVHDVLKGWLFSTGD